MNMYSVGQFAEISHLTVKQLHYLDRKNIFSPSIRNEYNNYRYYSNSQLEKVVFMQNVRRLGISFHKVVDIMEENSMEYLLRSISDNINQIQREIEKQSALARENLYYYQRLAEGLQLKCSDVVRTYRVVELPARRVIFMREAESSSVENMFVDRQMLLLKAAEERRISIVGDFSAIFHSGYALQFAKEYGDLETYYEVDESTPVGGMVKTLPAVKGVQGIYCGSYTHLDQFYQSMERWAKEKELHCTGKSIERYKTGPHMVSNEADYLTTVILVLE